jgi:hypothetical protein
MATYFVRRTWITDEEGMGMNRLYIIRNEVAVHPVF